MVTNANANILEVQGITIYLRDGKWYWMVKSCAFETPEQAMRDALRFCGKEEPREEYERYNGE